MAKKIVKSLAPREDLKNAPAAYFKSLTLENVKCFKGEQTIDLSDGNGKPANWTVILGNNNTGKTTILKAISLLEVCQREFRMVDGENEQGYALFPIEFEYSKVND